MGKRSTKENKNIYQLSREAAELSRESAEGVLGFISSDRIERIESGRSMPHPDEVLAMERGYKNAELTNYYCANECPIGKKYVPRAELKPLPQLTVELIAALHDMQDEERRLIGIARDGRVNAFEREQFDAILEKLETLDRTISSMRIWIEHALSSGKMDRAE